MGAGVPGCHSMASAARALRRARYSGSTAPGWLSLRWTVTSPSPERVTGAYSWASSNIAASGVSGRRTARRHSMTAGLGWRAADAGPCLVLKPGLHAVGNPRTQGAKKAHRLVGGDSALRPVQRVDAATSSRRPRSDVLVP